MLARWLTTTLPAITLPETIDTICTHSVTSLTGAHTTVVTARPCRAPHQTISDVGLIGGGQIPRPGEVSLAHHGGRFLDEWPECRRHVLDVLRSRGRRASQQYNLPHVLNLMLAELARPMMAVRDAGSAR
jgi:magnesium chelatase family protein